MKIGKKRQRKIDHLRRCKQRGDTKVQLQSKIKHMNMSAEDAQSALEGKIY